MCDKMGACCCGLLSSAAATAVAAEWKNDMADYHKLLIVVGMVASSDLYRKIENILSGFNLLINDKNNF